MKVIVMLMSVLLLFGAIADDNNETKIIYLIGMIATMVIAVTAL